MGSHSYSHMHVSKVATVDATSHSPVLATMRDVSSETTGTCVALLPLLSMPGVLVRMFVPPLPLSVPSTPSSVAVAPCAVAACVVVVRMFVPPLPLSVPSTPSSVAVTPCAVAACVVVVRMFVPPLPLVVASTPLSVAVASCTVAACVVATESVPVEASMKLLYAWSQQKASVWTGSLFCGTCSAYLYERPKFDGSLEY